MDTNLRGDLNAARNILEVFLSTLGRLPGSLIKVAMTVGNKFRYSTGECILCRCPHAPATKKYNKWYKVMLFRVGFTHDHCDRIQVQRYINTESNLPIVSAFN